MATTPNIIANGIYRVAAADLDGLNFGKEYAGAEFYFRPIGHLWGVEYYKANDKGVVDASGLRFPGTYEITCGSEIIDEEFQVTTRNLADIDAILKYGEEKRTNALQYGANARDAFMARLRATETIEEAALRHFTPIVEVADYINVVEGYNYPLEWPDAVLIGEFDNQPVKLVSDSYFTPKATGPVRFYYQSGLKRVKTDISVACTILASSYLTPTRVPERAMSETTDGYYVRFSIEGRDGPTGIPAVDAIIERNSRLRYRIY